MRRVVLILSASLVLYAIVATMSRVVTLQNEERSAWSERVPVGEALGETDARELLRVTLAQGQSATFSVCSEDRFEGAHWQGAHFLLRHHDPEELVLDAPLNEERLAHRRVGEAGACMDLASASSLAAGGAFSLAVVGGQRGAGDDPALWAHITGIRQLRGTDVQAPLFGGLGMLGLLLGALIPAGRRRDPLEEELRASEEPVSPPAPAEIFRLPASRVAVFALVGLVAVMVSSQLFPGGSAMAFGAGLLFIGVQLLLALGLTRHPRLALALVPPRRAAIVILLAMPVAGVALRFASQWFGQLFPATGVAPIEHLVSMPSGMLGTLALGFLAPVAEEIFFRGLLYGALERWRGRVFAFVLTGLVFALAHLPQTYGAWPSFVSVAVFGFALTAVRAASESTVASGLMHLGYNGLIALSASAQIWLASQG